MPTHQFTGPLFIVGMPRSGTKLLRGLLNEHSQIAIPLNETEFLPHWAKRWAMWGDLSDQACFQKFYDEVIKSVYFIHGYEEHERCIACKDWYHACENYTLAGVFKALVIHDSKASHDGIWGDKSPGYLIHLPFLKQYFPHARFIHITRDARDYCLSIQRAFGKSTLRAAQRWADRITQAKQDGAHLAEDYIEIRYEDLLTEPEVELTTLCEFLGVPFEASMLSMSRPSENLGDAAGQSTIVSDNFDKWRDKMSSRLRIQIERIAGEVLTELGYPVTESIRRKVPKIQMKILQIYDGVQMIRNEWLKRGLVKAVIFRLRIFGQTHQEG